MLKKKKQRVQQPGTPFSPQDFSSFPGSFDTSASRQGFSSGSDPFSGIDPLAGQSGSRAGSSGSPFSFDPMGGASTASGQTGFPGFDSVPTGVGSYKGFSSAGTVTTTRKAPAFRRLLLPIAVLAVLLFVLLWGRGRTETADPVEQVPSFAPETVVDTVPEAVVAPAPVAVPEEEAVEQFVVSSGPPRYYEQRLSAEDWTLYHQICDALSRREDQLAVTVRDHDSVITVFYQVVADFPEYFWVDRMDYYEWIETDEGDWDVTMYFVYNCTRGEMTQRKAAINALTERLKAELGGKSDYDKAKGVYEFLVDHTIYDWDYDDQTMFSVLLLGHGVCAGYAAATQYLLNSLGIESFRITGTAGDGGAREAHSWNMAKLNGDWYLIDTTWGDPVSDDGTQSLTYAYLGLTTSMMNINHFPDSPTDLPLCTATACNYYVHEGKYLSSYSYDAVRDLLLRAVESGENLDFMCADRACFDAAAWDLLDNNRCWELFESTGSPLYDPHSMSYYLDETHLIITLYITYY